MQIAGCGTKCNFISITAAPRCSGSNGQQFGREREDDGDDVVVVVIVLVVVVHMVVVVLMVVMVVVVVVMMKIAVVVIMRMENGPDDDLNVGEERKVMKMMKREGFIFIREEA